VVITGMCTAMRRGDCCCLKWSDVDLKEGFISVKTSKTGEKVDIPLFPLLREELERIKATAGGSGYCFPKAAEMYQSNPDGISVRVKQVLARAFEQKDVAEGRLLAPPTAEEVRGKCLIYMAGLGDTTKANRMRVVWASTSTGEHRRHREGHRLRPGNGVGVPERSPEGRGGAVDPDAAQETGIGSAAGGAARTDYAGRRSGISTASA
jgi:hypothetical protein